MINLLIPIIGTIMFALGTGFGWYMHKKDIEDNNEEEAIKQ